MIRNKLQGAEYRGVELLDSPFRRQRDETLELYASHPSNDDILHRFRLKAGLPSSARGMVGWGPSIGQYLGDEDAMAPQVRGEQTYLYRSVPGKSSPSEILDALAAFNAEGRPIWKPMHMQPIYRTHAFITAEGNGRGRTNAYIAGSGQDVGADIFRRGLCLPSDNKMTPEQQDTVIDIIHKCFA